MPSDGDNAVERGDERGRGRRLAERRDVHPTPPVGQLRDFNAFRPEGPRVPQHGGTHTHFVIERSDRRAMTTLRLKPHSRTAASHEKAPNDYAHAMPNGKT
jgi:hypothetical protein